MKGLRGETETDRKVVTMNSIHCLGLAAGLESKTESLVNEKRAGVLQYESLQYKTI